ncbi:MAG: cation diffusion facilitator family transporter, partial [Pseudomonadales bacterium]
INEQLMRRATHAAVATAMVLIVIKLVGWSITGSVSILASLVDSMLDTVVSFINLLAVRYSLTPPDTEHRFGHGKAEPLVGFVQVGFICASAIFLILHAFERLQQSIEVEHAEIGLAVMVVTTLATIVLVVYQRYVIRRTRSTVIAADSLHYLTDVLTNLGVILALLLSLYGFNNVDAIVAILIAIFILFSAMKIGVESFHHLMDHEIPDHEKAKLLELVHETPEVLGMHDLRTRQSGQRCFIQMHLDLDENLSLAEAHRIVDAVENRIAAAIEGADVIVHPDPVDPANPRTPGQPSSFNS